MSASLQNQILSFYQSLSVPQNLPEGVEVLFPQKNPEVIEVLDKFLRKYYDDNSPRQLLFGINPGRFGAGTTGINFTAPRQLSTELHIEHSFRDLSELSAEFIYEMINGYGGPASFYGDFFLTAVCPLGFTKNGKNLNYYDDKLLLDQLEDFIADAIEKQVRIFRPSSTCICIGGEKNFKCLKRLSEKYKFFKEIIPVAHPRFILQYRRKRKNEFLHQYATALAKLKQ